MDYEITTPEAGKISITFFVENNGYKLFRNFLKGNLNHPDSVIRNLLNLLDKDLDKPLAGTSVSSSTEIPHREQPSNTNLSNLSSKIDLLFKAVGGLKPSDNVSQPMVKFDTEILDGFAKRIEQMIHGVMNSKSFMPNDEQMMRQLGEIKQQMSACLSAVQKIQINPIMTVSNTNGTEVISQPAVSVTTVDFQQSKTVEATPPTAFSDESVIRYPSNSKKTRPKCFGQILSKEQDASTPCLSCVWVNECGSSDKKTDSGKPSCFGQYKKDLDCSLCAPAISSECINKSGK